MFAAVRLLTQTKSQALVVNNEAGETISQPEETAEVVANFFSKLFSIDTMEPVPMQKTGPLNRPIATNEITRATNSLRNGRAVGPDGIAGELLK